MMNHETLVTKSFAAPDAHSCKTDIIVYILTHGNEPVNSRTLQRQFPQYEAKNVHNRLSDMYRAGILRRTDEREPIVGYKYWVAKPENYYGRLVPHPGSQEPLEPVELSSPTVTEAVQAPEEPEHLTPAEPVEQRATKIVWSHTERSDLARMTAKIQLEEPYLSLHQAFDKAQEAILPEGRRRKVLNSIRAAAPWLAESVRHHKTLLQVENAPAPEPAPAEKTVDDFTTHQLVTALLGRFESKIREVALEIITSPEVRSMIRSELAPRPKMVEVPRHNPEAHGAEAQEARLMKVLIAGHLKPGHVLEIKESYGKLFDLRIWKHDENTNRLANMAKNVDKILFLTQGVSHQAENALKNVGVDYERVPGNVGVLKQRLAQIYEDQS